MPTNSSTSFSPEEIAAEGLTPSEYEEIVQRLGRHPNKAELGMFGVMWSEHCCYKNSRPLLKQFPTEGKRILVGPGENAGVVDLGDGLQLAFKIESHNHPSAVEPFQGAATGVGGILRDIFTMGARPIAVLNSLRFGTLDNANTRRLFNGVVAGISHYGNCVGVPTVGGEVYFDRAYTGNPLVNVMALGLMETPEIVTSGASGVGNPVLYVGSTTGRDGMGGASFASAELTDQSLDDRPAVQVGDPFLEKSLIEACLEAFQTGAVVAAQDMGAAGITCSTSEMAAKGGLGIEFDLDLVPVRETGMVPYEYLLSESQERMLFVAHKGREQELIDIFHRWGLHAVVAGKVIEEPLVRILFQGEVAAEIPATALADNTPIYQRELLTEPPDYALQAWEWHGDSLPPCNVKGIDINGKHYSWNDILGQLLDTPTIASKRWVYRQYDHQVQNNTLILPGNADAAVIRLRPQGLNVERLNVERLNVDRLNVVREAWPKGQGSTETNLKPANLKPANLKPANLQPETNLQPANLQPTNLQPETNLQPVTSSGGVAATVDCNSRYVYLDPYEGAKAVVAEAARNLSCVGAEPLAVTDNLNFGSPEKPVGYWQLASACAGIAEACREMSTPVTGGNVSLYNETIDSDGNPQSIYPTPVVGMVGLVADITKTCGQGWQAEGDLIYLLGLGTKYWENSQSQTKSQITLGASEYLATIHGMVAGKPPVVDFDLERRIQTVTREGISQGWVNSAHDCAEGGLVVALAESCIAGKLGADITLGYSSESLDLRWDQVLFGEGGSRILVSVSPQQETSWESYLQQQLGDEGYWQQLGVVQGENAGLRVLVGNGQCVIEMTVQEMCDCWENGIERRLRV
ncbi:MULTISPECIES: phosphoribosylformylglycinamidine synthase subunit PurL [unclassified Moorena]|uniref:phosphoribosylformylglycinamidine synthase subunit PurL n=1 Tax=unclassified Moorena TaxID=2683338 RepID=UPI0013C1291F|nr:MULTISPECIES: phosphoribosylformylglycinamidine synthase subunit PurL [unclassified Moorena]NEO09345.1 phosphoribosylformylglycinamidine synthase subunit PurL [Moorena sp. SIO3I8]NEP26229.1 phosphoribosylformylglycinamidine synthase subunit PurL [Moorena sp. SIO3I6]NEQ58555.1 phosphoribosylformylglycinamidine synthase subunit PurL [Moorena sp. SIO4A1]